MICQTAVDLDVRPRATGGTEVLMVFEFSGGREQGAEGEQVRPLGG